MRAECGPGKGTFRSGLAMLIWGPGGFLEPRLQSDTVLSVLWALESPLGTCRTGLGVPGPLAKHHLMTAVYFHTGVPKASYTPPEKLMAFSLTHSHSEAYVSSHLSSNYLGFHYSHSLSGHFS